MKGEYRPKNRTLRYMFDEKQPTKMCLRNVAFREVGGIKSIKVNRHYERAVEKSQYAYDVVQTLFKKTQDKLDFEELTNKTRRSVATVQSQFDSINKYVENFENMPKKEDGLNENIWKLTLAHFRKLLTKKKISPIDCDKLITEPLTFLSEPSASAGYPYICNGPTKKRDVVMTDSFREEMHDLLLFITRLDDANFLDYRTKVYPCVAYQKTAVVKPGKTDKVRFIWGYPLIMTMLEGIFSIPLIERCKELERETSEMFTSFTLQPYSQAYVTLQERYSAAPATVIDYSTYDSTVPDWVINDAFDLIFDMFTMQKEYRTIFKVVRHYFIHTPIVLSSGTMFVKHHGIPSGSWFTNIVGSLCNALMMMYISILAHKKPTIMKTMGDDNLTIKGRQDVGKFSIILKDTFGVVVNPSKCYIGPLTGAKFLGRTFSLSKKSFKGWVKARTDSIVSFIYPSKKDSEQKMWQRLLSLYLDNPCNLLWKLVSRNASAIKSSFSSEFDVDENRETVFTVFHGDYKLARQFMEKHTVDDLIVPPSMLDLRLGQVSTG